jgi:hypothetical protein
MFRGHITSKEEDIFTEGYNEFIRREEVKINLKRFKPVALAVREMTKTKGWKDVVEPFLRQKGNPAILFNLINKKEENFAKKAAEIEVFYRFLKWIEQLCKIADQASKIPDEE